MKGETDQLPLTTSTTMDIRCHYQCVHQSERSKKHTLPDREVLPLARTLRGAFAPGFVELSPTATRTSRNIDTDSNVSAASANLSLAKDLSRRTK